MVAVDLVALEQEIAQLGETLKSLKAAASGDIDKAAIAAAVAALLAAKKQYAENNNGIGVDGLAFAETKAQKKKAAKSTSAEADPNESAAEASNGKQVRL